MPDSLDFETRFFRQLSAAAAAAADSAYHAGTPTPVLRIIPRQELESYTPVRLADDRLNTFLFDSIAADPATAGRVPRYLPRQYGDSLRAEAIADSLADVHMPTIPHGHSHGIAGNALPPPYMDSTPLMAAFVFVLLLVTLNADSLMRALTAYRSELWSVRRRHNVFDDEHKAPLPIAVALAMTFCVFGGIALYNIPSAPSVPTVAGAGIAIGIVSLYYLLQLFTYRLVGYTFATPEGTKRFVGGFMATQAYAGLAMAIPAMLMVFYPEWHYVLITIAVSVYLLARVVFVSKGIRIFYKGIFSLFYFILYLCTIEILPVVALCRLSAFLSAASL